MALDPELAVVLEAIVAAIEVSASVQSTISPTIAAHGARDALARATVPLAPVRDDAGGAV